MNTFEFKCILEMSMKKRILLALVACTAFGENLVQNPGFEVGGNRPDAWDLAVWGTAAKATYAPDIGYQGTAGVLLTSPSDKDRISVAQFVKVEPGKNLRVRFRMKAEGVAPGKAVVRFTYLKDRADKTGTDSRVTLKPGADWTRAVTAIAVPESVHFVRIDVFILFGQGKLWVDDVEMEEVDAKDLPPIPGAGPVAATAAEKERALGGLESRLSPLRTQTLALFAANDKRAPGVFSQVLVSIHERARNFMAEPLRPVDMTTVVGRPYGAYNMDVWRLRSMAETLLALSQCYYLPKNPLSGKADAKTRMEATFAMLADHFQPDGSTHAPDGNIDRFILIPLSEAFVLCYPDLTEKTRGRVAEVLVNAAYYQVGGYGKREAAGTYPNMDAAYLQIMQFSGMAFGEKRFLDEAKLTIGYLGKCLAGGTWEYIQKWNPDPRYTRIVLEGVGRYWQMSGDPEGLRQIAGHRDWLKYFLEPGGLMDFGMSPFIKHDWQYVPYSAIGHGLDLIALAAPDPVLHGFIRQMRRFAEDKPGLLSSPFQLYWTAPENGEARNPDLNFIREAPEIIGMQGRSTGPLGTLTHYITGKQIAVDTRVSSIWSPAETNKPSIAFAGLYVELVQDETIYFIGDMEPAITRQPGVGLTITQKRHTLGPRVEAMPFGGHINSIKNWKHNCWKGGSPESLPVVTKEMWAMDGKTGLLRGEIGVRAETETPLAEVRLSSFLAPGAVDEVVTDAKALYLRRGALCLAIQATAGSWKPVVEKTLFHLKAEVPDGDYKVTLVSGDGQFPTEPFLISANEKEVPGAVSAEKGAFAKKTFDVAVKDGSIRLIFLPQVSGEHWKVNSLSIESKAGNFRRAWDVGPENVPVGSGFERLTGAAVHAPGKAIGWFKDLARQERDRGNGNGAERSLITCGDGVETKIRFADARSRKWAAGEEAKAVVTVGLAADVGAFRKMLAP